MIKNEIKKKMFHIQEWTSDWNLLTAKNHEVTWLWKCLEFVALIKTNIFGFRIKWFRVKMRKLWLKQDTKRSWRNSAYHFFSIFFKLCLEGRKIIFKREREGKEAPNWSVPRHLARVGCVWHTWSEDTSGCAAHGLHTWPSKLGRWPSLLLSRSTRVLQSYPGLQTPILNLSSNYESWLPHAQQQL